MVNRRENRVEVTPDRVIPKPEFFSIDEDVRRNNDLALLYFRNRITVVRHIRAIDLPIFGSYRPLAGEKCMGWGMTRAR